MFVSILNATSEAEKVVAGIIAACVLGSIIGLALIIVLAYFLGRLGRLIAQQRGINEKIGFWLGSLFGILGYIIILLIFPFQKNCLSNDGQSCEDKTLNDNESQSNTKLSSKKKTFVTPENSEKERKSNDDWICLVCNTRNPKDLNYCKGCGTNRDAPFPEAQSHRFAGAFKNEDSTIVIKGNSFKIYAKDNLINEGTVRCENDKLYLMTSVGNKKMTLTAINDNMLSTLNGKIYKKSLTN
ncbi:MAG: hypothetical protein IK048_05130 [Clostridia bacterium]|nr:hypothetical protein [Clostridia bacterium]